MTPDFEAAKFDRIISIDIDVYMNKFAEMHNNHLIGIIPMKYKEKKSNNQVSAIQNQSSSLTSEPFRCRRLEKNSQTGF